MAEDSQAQRIEALATDMTRVRGKIDHYDISKRCYDSALEERQEAAVQFEAVASQFIQKDADWQKWKTECSKVSDELCSLKKLSPEAEPLLAEFTPFEDIPSTATGAVAPLLDVSSESQLTDYSSVTQKLLKAAYSVLDLEHRNGLLRVLLQEKTDEVERLTQELKHSETDVQLQKEKISQLNAEIAKLKANMSPVGSSTTLSPIGEAGLQLNSLHLTTSEDVALDPAAMQEKIKQLTNRISELLNYNRQWKQQCDKVTRDLEAAKQELSEYQQLTEQKLQEEREKTNKAVAERDDALKKYRYLAEVEVPRLEATVRLLEEQQHLHFGQHGMVDSPLPPQADEDMRSELIATQSQAEEYRLGLEEERERHERTKANAQSMKQQWHTMYHQLQAKQKELNKANAELQRLQKETQRWHSRLEQANSDRELIQGRLKEHSPGEAPCRGSGSSGQPSQSTSSSSKTKPKRGTLEEDTPTAVIVSRDVRAGGWSEKSDNWTCDICGRYNTGRESLNECAVCRSERGKVVKYPVQETQTPYIQQASLTSRKTASGSYSSSSSSNKVGRSRLEEDGANSSPLHVVL